MKLIKPLIPALIILGAVFYHGNKLKEMEKIKENIQESLIDMGDDYVLKTNDELIEIIIDSGCGEGLFHTADIERLIKENIYFSTKIKI